MVFGLLVGVLVSANFYGAETSGVDIFIRACQNQGLNCDLIRSGYAEMEVQEFRHIDVASKKLELERVIEEQKRMFRDDPDTLKTLVTSLEKTIGELKDEETNYFRYAILFKGNDPGIGLRRVAFDKRIDGSDGWNPDSSYTMIVRGDIQKKNSTVRKRAVNRETRVSTSNYSVVQFQKFGRIQDMFSKTATISMLDSKNLDRFIFLPDKIAEFKKTIEQLKNQSNLSILQVVGSTPYDDARGSAIILESRNDKGIVYMRYWIDPSRGYICPLAQQYSPENGKILIEYSARNYFLHEKSGLWYPQECEEKTWDARSDSLLESRQYRINPVTFQINQPVSDEEFSIDIVENMVVVDERVTPNVVYVTTESGSLSLAQGGLDLDQMSWLVKEEKVDFALRPAAWITTRYVLMFTGVTLTVTALLLMWRNRYAKGV
jgi:hypothetical protein